MLCSRCKKRNAVIFISKIENGVTTNEGLCFKCARELGIAPVNDMIEKMGLTPEMLDSMSNISSMEDLEKIMEDIPPETLNRIEGLFSPMTAGENDDDEGDGSFSQTPPMSFFSSLNPDENKKEVETEPEKDSEKKR